MTTPSTLTATAGNVPTPAPSSTTTCVVNLDRAYTVPFNYRTIDSVERETGKSMAEINNVFLAARGIAALVPVGFLTKFVIGAIVAVDSSFRMREDEALPPGKVLGAAEQMAAAWNAAVCLFFNLAPDEAQKKGPPLSEPAAVVEPSATSPNAESGSTTPST